MRSKLSKDAGCANVSAHDVAAAVIRDVSETGNADVEAADRASRRNSWTAQLRAAAKLAEPVAPQGSITQSLGCLGPGARSENLRDPTSRSQAALASLILASHGADRQPRVIEFCSSIASACQGEPFVGKSKGVNRIWEKVCMSRQKRFDCSAILDVARGGVVCKDMASMKTALEFIESSETVDLIRIKVRFADHEATAGGWRDILLNFVFKDDWAKHVCELQLVHANLLEVRQNMGAHHDYGIFRSALEILEWHEHPFVTGARPESQRSEPEPRLSCDVDF